jgi:hypothetical protein
MSDRDLIQKIFDALCAGADGSDFFVSKMGDKIFIEDTDNTEYCLAVFRRVDEQSPKYDPPCETCNDDPVECAKVPGSRHCERSQR